MAIDLTPKLAPGRTLIEAYGQGGFRIAGRRYAHSVLVRPGEVIPWPVKSAAEISVESLAPLLGSGGRPDCEILLLGCGPRLALLSRPLRDALRAAGFRCDAMDSGAACRTYNVLLAEERRVAAALIAVE